MLLINVYKRAELTEGEITAVGREELLLHEFQEVEFPCDENMWTASNPGHKLSVFFFVHYGSLNQRFIIWILHLLFWNTGNVLTHCLLHVSVVLCIFSPNGSYWFCQKSSIHRILTKIKFGSTTSTAWHFEFWTLLWKIVRFIRTQHILERIYNSYLTANISAYIIAG